MPISCHPIVMRGRHANVLTNKVVNASKMHEQIGFFIQIFLCLSPVFGDCPEKGNQIVSGYPCLDIMNGIEYEAAVFSKNPHALLDLGPNLFRGAKGESLLGVDSTTPKDDLFTKL